MVFEVTVKCGISKPRQIHDDRDCITTIGRLKIGVGNIERGAKVVVRRYKSYRDQKNELYVYDLTRGSYGIPDVYPVTFWDGTTCGAALLFQMDFTLTDMLAKGKLTVIDLVCKCFTLLEGIHKKGVFLQHYLTPENFMMRDGTDMLYFSRAGCARHMDVAGDTPFYRNDVKTVLQLGMGILCPLSRNHDQGEGEVDYDVLKKELSGLPEEIGHAIYQCLEYQKSLRNGQKPDYNKLRKMIRGEDVMTTRPETLLAVSSRDESG